MGDGEEGKCEGEGSLVETAMECDMDRHMERGEAERPLQKKSGMAELQDCKIAEWQVSAGTGNCRISETANCRIFRSCKCQSCA